MTRYRPTWVEISKGAFAKNVAYVKKTVGASTDVLAVLKADAYGHGAEQLAPVAMKSGASIIGVSSLEEGLALRRAGILAPILILGGIYPFKNASVAFQSDLTPTVASFAAAQALAQIAYKRKQTIPFHLKVDTGMGRIGVSVDEAIRILDWLQKPKPISLEGIYSHFASADSDPRFSAHQIRQFSHLRRQAEDLGFSDVQFHMANSAGLISGKKSHFDMVRPGLVLYGIVPISRKKFSISPVLTWQTRVIFLKNVPKGTSISYGRTFTTRKPSTIATLPVGYADGLPRLASNRGSVLIKGKKCRIVGRVTMDHIMVDVTGARVSVGDPVVLIGKQKTQQISAHDWANWADTNAYEILCGISKRVPREYVR